MKERIKDNIANPLKLEQLYREDKLKFKESFLEAKNQVEATALIRFWEIRLEYLPESGSNSYNTLNIRPLLLSILIVVFFMRFSDIFGLSGIKESMYNYRNPVLIVFAGMMFYELFQKKRHNLNNWLVYSLIYAVIALQLNVLPDLNGAQVLKLAIMHTPVFLWFFYGFARCPESKCRKEYWVKFLKFNGDLLVFSGLIAICWMIIFAISFGLFNSLNLSIEESLIEKWMITAFAVTPLIALFAIERAGDAAEKIVPLIARIFNPIVLIVLVIYISVLFRAGENLYGEREFLLLFNLILICVLAIILFSLSNMPERGSDRYRFFILYLLTLLSCSLNMLAISAIIYRMISYGISPNRLAVAGVNILIFINLIKVGIDLLQVHAEKKSLDDVVRGIAGYLPVYGIWSIIVVVIFPIVFL